MTEKEKYAVEWNESAQYFYDNNSYTQLTAHIKHFKRVLEIGCGTGQSTLSLLKAGHSVVAIDQNPHCIKIAKKLVSDAGFDIKESLKDLAPRTVFFLEKDITDSGFLEMICASLSIDIVVCWNIGSYWDKQKDADVIPKMLEYGLTADQIQHGRLRWQVAPCRLLLRAEQRQTRPDKQRGEALYRLRQVLRRGADAEHLYLH